MKVDGKASLHETFKNRFQERIWIVLNFNGFTKSFFDNTFNELIYWSIKLVLKYFKRIVSTCFERLEWHLSKLHPITSIQNPPGPERKFNVYNTFRKYPRCVQLSLLFRARSSLHSGKNKVWTHSKTIYVEL